MLLVERGWIREADLDPGYRDQRNAAKSSGFGKRFQRKSIDSVSFFSQEHSLPTAEREGAAEVCL
jgi:hypothetical protein